MTETEKIFKQNLIYLREKHQISGYRVAKETGINSTYYYRLESFEKKQSLNYDVVERLAKFYDIEPYELFKKMES